MKSVQIEELDFQKGDGLIPVIVQEASSGEVLTLAYVNIEALKQTINTGLAHYYRRSHRKVMLKGITSGNTQALVEIRTDCDNDALIFRINQKGPACHLGSDSCFHALLETRRTLPTEL
ncbi:MAG: phosphoribosyl-AMP cyclohydrolase [Candidatus Thorarchaeota archaeon]